MKLTLFDRAILIGIVLASFANLFSGYLSEHYKPAQGLFFRGTIIFLLFWVLFVAGRLLIAKLTAGRSAVETLILNSRNELLVYFHPHHRKHLPPGGRVGSSEFPDTALASRLRERLHLEPQHYRFDELFHPDMNPTGANIGSVQRRPAPFIVQRETTRQRLFVTFHYDYLYVLRLVDDRRSFEGVTAYAPVRFLDIEAVRELSRSGQTFPDVADAYERVLKKIGSARTKPNHR